MIQEPDVATHLGHCPLQSIVRLWDVWCVILWMFSADSRLSRLTLFPVYLHYPGSGCSLALVSRHNLSRWLWVLMRTPPDMIICWSLLRHSPSLHVTVSAVTQSASVPRHVSQQALLLVRRPTGALSLVRCHVCHGWGRNYYKWLRSRALMPRSWPGGPDPDQREREREVRWGEVRWPMRERRVASSEQWGNPGLGPVQAGSSPASAGENISSAGQISRWRMFSKKTCRPWIKFVASSMDEDIYFSSFTG